MKDDEGTFCALKRFLAILALFAFLHFRQFVCVCRAFVSSRQRNFAQHLLLGTVVDWDISIFFQDAGSIPFIIRTQTGGYVQAYIFGVVEEAITLPM